MRFFRKLLCGEVAQKKSIGRSEILVRNSESEANQAGREKVQQLIDSHTIKSQMSFHLVSSQSKYCRTGQQNRMTQGLPGQKARQG
jgi:hypothetical protein